MYVACPVIILPVQQQVGQYAFLPVTLQGLDAHFEQKAQVLIVEQFFTVQAVLAVQQAVYLFVLHVEPVHDALHPCLEVFLVDIHKPPD
nr:hypothetical protein PU94_12505 [Coprobacter secundus]